VSDLWDQLQSAESNLANEDSPQVAVFQTGMAALKAMQNSNSATQREEETLKAASAFIEALMYQPEWPEAMMGLSYWLYLVGDSAAAIHYAERTLEQDKSREDAQDLLATLQSVQQLNTMQDNLQHMGGALGAESSAKDEPLMEVRRISLLLQVHHQLINLELDKDLLNSEAQLYSRQACLETLVQMLVMQLEKGFPDTQQLHQQLETVSGDLARLEALKQAFLLLRQFRSEVQKYFSELTRMVIGIRMEQAPMGKTMAEVLKRLKKLDQHFAYLKDQLQQAPESIQGQMRSLSGWEHVEVLYAQLKDMA
jgi:tetratricopeptide (TPR) repeat protein